MIQFHGICLTIPNTITIALLTSFSEDVPLHCHTIAKHYFAFEVELFLRDCRVPGGKKGDYIYKYGYWRMFSYSDFQDVSIVEKLKGCRDPIYGIKLAPPLEIYQPPNLIQPGKFFYNTNKFKTLEVKSDF